MFGFEFFFRTMQRAGMGLLGIFQIVGQSFTKPIIQWIAEYDNVANTDVSEFMLNFESVVHDLATGEADGFVDSIVRAVIGPLLFYIYELFSVSMFDIILWMVPAVILLNLFKKLWEALPIA